MTGPFGFAVLVFGTWRITRLIALDTVWDETRARLQRWARRGFRPLPESADEVVGAFAWDRKHGFRVMLGEKFAELIGCPFCVSVWVSAATTLGWWYHYRMAGPVAWGFAVAGVCAVVAHLED